MNMEVKKRSSFGRDFVLVAVGQIVSLFGNAVLRFALPLYLLRKTGSPALFGTVTALSFIPMIPLSIIGGILADRVNKRNIMVILDFLTAVLSLVVYFVFEEVSAVPLFITILMLLYGIAGIYQPTVQASIPLLVDEEHLLRANAVINLISTLANLLGPVIGGLLFASAGLEAILILSGLCFTLSAIMEIFIHIPFIRRRKERGILATAGNDLKDSLAFVKEEKPIFFSVALIVAAFNLVLTAVMIVGMPIVIIQTLEMSDAKLGISQGVLALGGLSGGIVAAAVQGKLKVQEAYRLLGVCGVSVALMGTVLFFDIPETIAYTVITGLCFFAMGAATLFTIQIFAMVQARTPPDLVGKIIAALIAAALSAQPTGQAIYGFLFEHFKGGESLILLCGASISMLITLYSKSVFRKM